MILIDKDIKNFVSNGKIISKGFDESHLKGIAYELTIDVIHISDTDISDYDLQPGETVFVKTNEELFIPEDITGRVIERNSVMRAGLKVDAPQYIPNHKTFAFLRVQNISNNIFTLKKGFAIAQIMFEKLTGIPEQTYDKQSTSNYADENSYRGLGQYTSEYSKLTKKFSEVKEDLESLKDKIYANILTFMGIFVAIFTLVSVNIQAFAVDKITPNLIAKVNLCLGTVITILLGLILLIINKSKKRWFNILYLILVFALLCSTIFIAIK